MQHVISVIPKLFYTNVSSLNKLVVVSNEAKVGNVRIIDGGIVSVVIIS